MMILKITQRHLMICPFACFWSYDLTEGQKCTHHYHCHCHHHQSVCQYKKRAVLGSNLLQVTKLPVTSYIF